MFFQVLANEWLPDQKKHFFLFISGFDLILAKGHEKA